MSMTNPESTPALHRPAIGCQLIVFGPTYDLDRDADVVLDCVAAAGYAGVEGCGRDTLAFKRRLDARGLQTGGLHTGLKGLIEPAALIERAHILETRDISNSGFMTWEGRSLEDYRTAIRVLNEAGLRLREEGLRLHYHNHDFEFEQVTADRRGIDLLLDELDPEAVDLCVDVAWVLRGGDDPAAFLRTYADRIGYLHLKDTTLPTTTDGARWTELGRGAVDLAAILDVLPLLTRVPWAMIEQDHTDGDPRASATESRHYLRNTFNL